MRKYLLLILTIAAFAGKGHSQQTVKTVTGNFIDVPFNQFVQEVETQTGYRFYYDPAQTDTIKITYRADQLAVNLLLEDVLKATELHYAIDGDNRVFITKGVSMFTSLPNDFFGRRKTTDTTMFMVAAPQDFEKENAMNKLKLSLENKLFEIGIKTNEITPGGATIAGYIRDAKTGEAIIGANIFTDDRKFGTVTDQFGYFSLTLPKGRHILLITSVGMSDTKRQVMLYSNGKLNIELYEYVPSLKRVVVSADKTVNVKGVDMGVQKITIKNIKQIPTIFGEADILRVVLSMPGVTSVGESSTGFNVRGGGADENLILFSDATIYNPSHFFGFFSAFNPDVVKDVELYKSSIPEKYGGRLASVLDVTTREGNKKKFTVQGGIGPLTSRLTLEGPLDSAGKTSFILGGRTTYSDWILRNIPNPDYANSSASFYDLNLNINHDFDSKNSLYVMGYLSQDRFRLNSDTLYDYSNKNANVKWKHIFNNKFYGVFTAGIDNYDFSISSTQNPIDAYKFAFDVNQTTFRADFTYALNNKHTLDFGLTSIYYKLDPGTYTPNSAKSLVVADTVHSEQALETALYIGDHYDVSSKFSINAGLRYSIYNYLGPQTVYEYGQGLPREVTNITDTVNYPSGKVIKTYSAPEVRLSARYSLSDNSSIKISFNTLQQYIHMLSNTTAISPTDIWKLSDQYIKPQSGDQISLGFYKNLKSNTIETSVEVYYKHLTNYLDYKSGAQLILNNHIETDVINDVGYAYGAEFFIKKTEGKLNGWISYTYSRTFLKSDDPLAQPVNGGAWYPSDYDKPNVVNFVGNYRFSHRFSISVDVNYSTGRPITLPIAEYYYDGSYRVLYSDRNEYRIPDYFRTDFSMNIDGSHKIKKLAHSSWTLGLYNVTGRKNPYSVYFTSENGVVNGYKLSIFGAVIPFVTYNFKF